MENHLLASLSANDADALRPILKRIHLEQKTLLYEPGGMVNAVYFPTTAVVSLVVGLSTGEGVEAAMLAETAPSAQRRRSTARFR